MDDLTPATMHRNAHADQPIPPAKVKGTNAAHGKRGAHHRAPQLGKKRTIKCAMQGSPHATGAVD